VGPVYCRHPRHSPEVPVGGTNSEHGEDEVAVVVFTAKDNYSWLYGYNGANLARIRHMLQVSINIPVEEQQPFKKYMMEVLLSA
jgi:hypothetical protein